MQGLGSFGMVALASVCAFCAAYLALVLSGRHVRKLAPGGPADWGDADKPTFLVEDSSLIDTSLSGAHLLDSLPNVGTEWERLLAHLEPDFPTLVSDLASLGLSGHLELTSQDGQRVLRAEPAGSSLRIVIEDTNTELAYVPMDASRVFAMETELETLRVAVEETPFLVWRQSEDGGVTWANQAYLDAAQRFGGSENASAWPPVALFSSKSLGMAETGITPKRVSLSNLLVGTPQWFEVHCAKVGAELLFSAVDVNATVHAENQLREFMQTLTKTFAHLTIGLAVFDRARRLALFNPALGDLTNLPVDFLTGRPTLVGFLDRLRDTQMIPEPKDYRAWRRQMAELEAAAANGTYSETWALPGGQTYRVTGRPHPGGAVAFLLEDISAEISLTRRFRSQLDLSQAVIDSLEEAIAVFAPDGTLALSNQPYEALWGMDSSSSLAETTVVEATRTWMASCVPSPAWGELREFVIQPRDRSPWTTDIRRIDGSGLTMRAVPLQGGFTLVSFAQSDVSGALPAPAPKIAQA